MGKATGPVYKVAFRRRRKNITNYSKRLELVKGRKPRMVVRKSSSGVLVQFYDFSPEGDRILSSVPSSRLKKYGWFPRRNSPTAYLCGFLAGKEAGKNGVTEFILDIGMYTPSKGSIVFAALKGAIDAGLKTNYSEEKIDEKRISGEVIGEYAKKLKESDAEKYNRSFASYIKGQFPPEKIAETFKSVKGRIENGE